MINIDDILKKIDFLVPFSSVAQKALLIIAKNDFTVKDLIETIKYEPALTANIIKTANSSLFAHSKPINNITTAINYLGRNQLFSIITVSSSKHYFDNQLKGYEERQGELWEHNLSVAMISRELKHFEPDVDENLLFTGALLHDIGKLVLSNYTFQELGKLYALIEKEDVDFIEAENKVFGITHPELGARILEKWKFSEDIVHAVRFHHDPENWNKAMTRLVALADYIALVIGKVSQKDALAYKGYEFLLEHYKIKSRELDLIISSAVDRINLLLSTFNVSGQ